MSNVKSELGSLKRLAAVEQSTAAKDSPEAAAPRQAALAARAHTGTENVRPRPPAATPAALADAARKEDAYDGKKAAEEAQ